MNAHDLIADAIGEKGGFDSVFWVACGGSLIDLLPAHELLKREATTFASEAYTAREFDIMRPKRLGEKVPCHRLQPLRQHPRGNRCVLDRQGGGRDRYRADGQRGFRHR